MTDRRHSVVTMPIREVPGSNVRAAVSYHVSGLCGLSKVPTHIWCRDRSRLRSFCPAIHNQFCVSEAALGNAVNNSEFQQFLFRKVSACLFSCTLPILNTDK